MKFDRKKYNPQNDINECTSRGACSIAPNIAALQELVLYYLKQNVHYLLELNKLGADNRGINLDIINTISSLLSVNEFSENQLYSIVVKEYYFLENIKNTYTQLIKSIGLKGVYIKNYIDFSPSFSLSKAITLGEKIFFDNSMRNLSLFIFCCQHYNIKFNNVQVFF